MNPFHGQALIVVGDASETLDMLYPYDRLIEAGIRPVIAGPERRPYQRVMHEVKPGWTATHDDFAQSTGRAVPDQIWPRI